MRTSKVCFLILACNLLLNLPVLSQKHDYTWVLGYAGGDLSPDEDTFGLSILHFPEESLQISDNQEGEALFRGTNVSFSNSDASFFCSFDGTDLYGRGRRLV
jgi:hypothetical protein